MRATRRVLVLLLIFGGAFPLFYVTTMVDRQSYRNAVSAYIQKPGVETEARLRSERTRNEISRARYAIIAETTVSAIAFGVYALYRLWRSRRSNREH